MRSAYSRVSQRYHELGSVDEDGNFGGEGEGD